MSDPTDAIRDILWPGFNAPVTPIRTSFGDGTLNLRFSDAHDDDYQAAGDNLRDRRYIEDLVIEDDAPNPWEVC